MLRPLAPGRFEYRYGETVFTKELTEDGGVRFFKDGAPLSLEEWNLEINKFQSMAVKEKHPNPAVRLLEHLRRFTLIEFMRPSQEDVAADVGCESGFIAQALHRLCKKLYMIDIDPGLLDMARERIRAGNVEFIQSCATDINLPDSAVDIVLASEILEHLPDQQAALRELLRITKPGGRIIISVPNDPLILTLKALLRACGLGRALGGLSSGLAVGHLRLYSPASLRAVCRGFGYVARCRYSLPVPLNIYLELVKFPAAALSGRLRCARHNR